MDKFWYFITLTASRHQNQHPSTVSWFRYMHTHTHARARARAHSITARAVYRRFLRSFEIFVWSENSAPSLQTMFAHILSTTCVSGECGANYADKISPVAATQSFSAGGPTQNVYCTRERQRLHLRQTLHFLGRRCYSIGGLLSSFCLSVCLPRCVLWPNVAR